MATDRKIIIVIPAYNEAAKIGEVIAGLSSNGYSIVAIDDGSRDDTYKVLSELPVCALKHPFNLGQGAALQTGIDYAKTQNADIVVTFDADGQHHKEDIETMIRPILEGKAEVVFGSRFLGKAINMPRVRGKFVHIATFIFGIISGLKLSDANCGIRAFSRPAMEKIYITQNRMAHTLDIIEQVKMNKLAYAEVPVTIEYTEYSLNKGQSLGGSLRIFIDWVMRL